MISQTAAISKAEGLGSSIGAPSSNRPLGIFSILMIVICYAVWGMMDGYDLTPTGIPDASDQLMILLAWTLPITAVVLGLVWFKRVRRTDGEVPR